MVLENGLQEEVSRVFKKADLADVYLFALCPHYFPLLGHKGSSLSSLSHLMRKKTKAIAYEEESVNLKNFLGP